MHFTPFAFTRPAYLGSSEVTFTSTQSWIAPQHVSPTTPICVWGVGGGGSGGSGGVGGSGSQGGCGTWGSAATIGGNGGSSYADGSCLTMGGGSGSSGSAGCSGVGGCPGCGGGGGGPGGRGNQGNGNIYSYPASPCTVLVGPCETVCAVIGSGGSAVTASNSGYSGCPTIFCNQACMLFCYTGGSGGSAGANGGAPAIPDVPSASPLSGNNGQNGSNAGFSWAGPCLNVYGGCAADPALIGNTLYYSYRSNQGGGGAAGTRWAMSCACGGRAWTTTSTYGYHQGGGGAALGCCNSVYGGSALCDSCFRCIGANGCGCTWSSNPASVCGGRNGCGQVAGCAITGMNYGSPFGYHGGGHVCLVDGCVCATGGSYAPHTLEWSTSVNPSGSSGLAGCFGSAPNTSPNGGYGPSCYGAGGGAGCGGQGGQGGSGGCGGSGGGGGRGGPGHSSYWGMDTSGICGVSSCPGCLGPPGCGGSVGCLSSGGCPGAIVLNFKAWSNP